MVPKDTVITSAKLLVKVLELDMGAIKQKIKQQQNTGHAKTCGQHRVQRKQPERKAELQRGRVVPKSKYKKRGNLTKKNGMPNYKAIYEIYHGTKKAIKQRTKRNQARKMMEKKGRVRKGDGKEVDHIKPLSKGGSNKRSNLRVVSRRKNRKKRNQYRRKK